MKKINTVALLKGESLIASGEKNDCTVYAIATAFELDYDAAHQEVTDRMNREEGTGVKRRTVLEALAEGTTINGKTVTRIIKSPTKTYKVYGNTIPRQLRLSSFAKATGKLAKTDAIDAQILAHFGEAMQPQILAVESEESRQLGDLISRRRQLVEMRTAEKKRRERARGKALVDIEAHLEYLLEDSQLSILLTQSKFLEQLPQFPANTICLDQDWSTIAKQSTVKPLVAVEQHNLAYIIYT